MSYRLVIKSLFVSLSLWFVAGVVLADRCPTDNGSGVGCAGDARYYCNNNCYSATDVVWCANVFSKDNSAGNCHSGAPGCDGNCSGSDGCGICNQCDSGYLLCTGANFNKCAQVGGVPGVDANCSSCTWSGSNNYTCTACGAGYSLVEGACYLTINSSSQPIIIDSADRSNQLIMIIAIISIGGLILFILLLLK